MKKRISNNKILYVDADRISYLLSDFMINKVVPGSEVTWADNALSAMSTLRTMAFKGSLPKFIFIDHSGLDAPLADLVKDLFSIYVVQEKLPRIFITSKKQLNNKLLAEINPYVEAFVEKPLNTRKLTEILLSSPFLAA